MSDQHREVGVSFGNRTKYLPASAHSFDIADAHLQVTFALFAAADDGPVTLAPAAASQRRSRTAPWGRPEGLSLTVASTAAGIRSEYALIRQINRPSLANAERVENEMRQLIVGQTPNDVLGVGSVVGGGHTEISATTPMSGPYGEVPAGAGHTGIRRHVRALLWHASRNCRPSGPSGWITVSGTVQASSMSIQVPVFDTFCLAGDRMDRLRQSLRVAFDQARTAHDCGYSRHVEDALTEIEETIAHQLNRIDNAIHDDKAEAEESGKADDARRASFARYRAA